MPECQCHGLNPDCYVCNGTGWVSHDTVIMRGHSEAETEEKTKRDPLVLPPYISRRKAQFGRKCPYCGETKIGLSDHIRAKHPEKSHTNTKPDSGKV